MNNLDGYIFVGTEAKGDVKVWLNRTDENEGQKIELKSKSEKKYGEHIKKVLVEMLKENKLQNIHLIVEDNGALDFAIKARLECAILRLNEKEGI